jgi:hypothetical protein
MGRKAFVFAGSLQQRFHHSPIAAWDSCDTKCFNKKSTPDVSKVQWDSLQIGIRKYCTVDPP